MIANEPTKPSDAPGRDPGAAFQQQALTMAVAILADRVRGLPAEDQKDLVALVNELPNSDADEVESILTTLREILEQSPSRLRRMKWTGDEAEPPDGLKRWTSTVSCKIERARTAAGLTQSQLSEKTGLPQSHISRLERGKHSPSRATLEKIATALGTDVRDFDPSA